MAELESQPKSIQSLYGWYSENKLWVNRRYQRKLVWTLEEKQKLVESVLRRYPIPAILLAEREGGGYEVIDGLQRLHTLTSFIETAFTTLDDRYFTVAEFVTAKNRASEGKFKVSIGETLSSREVSTLLDYSIAVSVMRGATDVEVDDVFARINTYGHRLSDQERRQSGVRDEFSTLVRQLSCEVRGDASGDVLGLDKMPSISIDLPMTKHGYEVQADEVFWVRQGVLTATDLRDSMDEQCVADIAASVILGGLVDRSKDALDRIYQANSVESRRVRSALDSYGAERFSAEFKLCIDEIREVCSAGGSNSKLRSVVFARSTTNPFPAVFTVLFVAFHELLIAEGKKIADYPSLKIAITGLDERINTRRSSTKPAERRKNVDTIVGLIRPYFVDGEHRDIYGDHTSTDIDAMIRRSIIEAAHYELKQGMLQLQGHRECDPDLPAKIARTIAAIANNGKGRAGDIVIGVADKKSDADRIRVLDGIEPRRVGQRFVVGVQREAAILGDSPERYFARWKDMIRSSRLPQALKDDVLANLTHSDYYGLGVIVIHVPSQQQVTLINDAIYIRHAGETVQIAGMSRILDIGKRFN